MPGKVNPVIIESLTMAIARVLGNDCSVTLCGQSGSFFELNVMMPLAGYCTLESISLLANSSQNFADRCIAGLAATSAGPDGVERGLMLVTALAPVLGYDEAAKLAKEAAASGQTIRDLARQRGLPEAQINELLDPSRMTNPGDSEGSKHSG
jgi:fumarate hydratase class II